IRPRRRRRGDPVAYYTPRSHDALQFGHGVAAVETVTTTWSAAPEDCASIRPRRRRRGDAPVAVRRAVRRLASIRPRRRRRGDQAHGRSAGTVACCFNSATASPPWRPHMGPATNVNDGGFNSATASPPWRPLEPLTE